MRQSALRRELGVSRPTVSRMLASLEKLGIVRRQPDLTDRRMKRVALTRRGCTLIRKARRIFLDSGWAQLALDSAFDLDQPNHRWCDELHCLVDMETLEDLLGRIRQAFGDFALLHYPWHPDD